MVLRVTALPSAIHKFHRPNMDNLPSMVRESRARFLVKTCDERQKRGAHLEVCQGAVRLGVAKYSFDLKKHTNS
jgi:hypothetical protein